MTSVLDKQGVAPGAEIQQVNRTGRNISSLPLADYLAPLAQEKFFHNGFCVEFLGMRRQGVMEAISHGRRMSTNSSTYLALEIWGRLFFLEETEGR